MTDDELFVKALTEYKDNLSEQRKENKRMDGQNKEIAGWYDDCIAALEQYLPQIEDLFSIYEFEEDVFLFLIDCFENYLGVYIIDHNNPELKKKQEAEFDQLNQILESFYDDDEDDEDDDFDDDEESDEENQE